jgi:hypothetical protein
VCESRPVLRARGKVIGHILVDRARRRKRRSGAEPESFLEGLTTAVPAGVELELLDLALKLEELDPWRGRRPTRFRGRSRTQD